MIEGELGSELFFIVNGRVSVLHRQSRTLIVDLFKDQYFGEISFFLEVERKNTIKARDFTEVLILERESFIKIAL